MKKILLIAYALTIGAPSFAQWSTSGNNTIHINSGNVSIGTNAPRANLDVSKILNEGELGTVLGRLQEGDASGEGTFLGVRAYRTQLDANNPLLVNLKSFSLEHSFYGYINSSINFLRGGNTTGGSISFNTDNNFERMRILHNGNVGIGTISPDAKLSVKGTIHTQEVRVDMNGWADYVFKPSYKLPSLASIKTYIEKNQHLPEMPSEADVAKEGVNLGEMVKLQTKKIEELTLYLIEQNKQLKAQQKQIKQLKRISIKN